LHNIELNLVVIGTSKLVVNRYINMAVNRYTNIQGRGKQVKLGVNKSRLRSVAYRICISISMVSYSSLSHYDTWSIHILE